jgi:hypothetical protein
MNNININDTVFLGLIILAMLLLVGWILKKYLSINKQQIKKKSSRNFIDIDPVNLTVTNSNTITESNNALSNQPFDGVNQNPEYKDHK